MISVIIYVISFVICDDDYCDDAYCDDATYMISYH